MIESTLAPTAAPSRRHSSGSLAPLARITGPDFEVLPGWADDGIPEHHG